MYQVATRQLVAAPLPAPGSVQTYTALAAPADPFVYFFPHRPHGVIEWDTRTDTGRHFAYPYAGPGPGFGKIDPASRTLWCPIWNGNAVARFDLRARRWTGFWPSPFGEQTQPTHLGFHGDRFICEDLWRPRSLAFDTGRERWEELAHVPGRVAVFGVLGGGFVYRGRYYCALASLRGYIPPQGPLRVDAKPWHFLDRRLAFDPARGRFAWLVCPGGPGEYWLSYAQVLVGKHLYLIAFNARQADGAIAQFGQGNAAIFQTHPLAPRTPSRWRSGSRPSQRRRTENL
jgi:hypothetical protein